MMKNTLLFMYTESSVHAGTGSGLSAIDLPIQRERSTEYPIIQGSGVKGALRSQANGDKDTINAIFGPAAEDQRASEHAGALSVGEARIVLFPVRSLMGVFAYVTSPMALARLARDAQNAGLPTKDLPIVPELEDNMCYVTTTSKVSDPNSKKVILEEFSFDVQSYKEIDGIAEWLKKALPQTGEYQYWRDKLKTSLVILPEDVFRDFVKNSTEVTTHIKLKKETKTVDGGALWTQEALPSDCLLYSKITARQVRLPVRDEHGKILRDVPSTLGQGKAEDVQVWIREYLPPRIQIGGDETTGQGCVALRWYEEK